MKVLRLPWKGREVPYATLDVIRGCNCICKTCYNRTQLGAKPVEQIAREIDLAFSLRRVEFLGILGGEPLLHPQIVDIVKMVKARGVGAVMLTNGILWNEQIAKLLAEAGLKMVYFHIQTGQRRPDLKESESWEEVEQLAAQKCAIARAAGIDAAVSTTVRADQPELLKLTLDAFRRNRACSHAFLTLERSMQTIDAGVEKFAATNDVETCRIELGRLGWLPFAGIGGRIHPEKMRWLIFHAYQRLDAQGRETGFATVPPSLFERSIFALLRLCGKRLPLRTDPSPAAVLVRIILNALTGGPFRNLFFALGTIIRGERLVGKNVFVEAFPDLLPDGRAEYCDPCVDASIQDGKLVPPCLTDTAFAKEYQA